MAKVGQSSRPQDTCVTKRNPLAYEFAQGLETHCKCMAWDQISGLVSEETLSRNV